MFAKWGGGEVLKKAVSGMLPKNRLRDKRLARLKVFETMAHPYRKNIVSFGGVPHGPREGGAVIQEMEATKKVEPPQEMAAL
jgi:Ribosomal protein L13